MNSHRDHSHAPPAAASAIRPVFTPAHRLHTKREFTAVFQNNHRSSDALLTLLAQHNGLAHARLGLAVSKKTSKLAVERNRLKRIIRESFRHQCAHLPPVDIVAITRPGAGGTPAAALQDSLARHWRRICTRCAS